MDLGGPEAPTAAAELHIKLWPADGGVGDVGPPETRWLTWLRRFLPGSAWMRTVVPGRPR